MFKAIMNRIFKGEKGFTLVELLAVTGTIAILAGIVATSAAGTGDNAQEAVAQSDASTTNGALGTYFSDQDIEVLSQQTVTLTTDINGSDTHADRIQEISTQWPEDFITEEPSDAHAAAATGNTVTSAICSVSIYCLEFPTSKTITDDVVVNVIILDLNRDAIDEATLLTDYTALDFTKLFAGGYIQALPDSESATDTVTVDVDPGTVDNVKFEFHSFLWLLRKGDNSTSGDDTDRSPAVFSLESVVVVDDEVTLDYLQIS